MALELLTRCGMIYGARVIEQFSSSFRTAQPAFPTSLDSRKQDPDRRVAAWTSQLEAEPGVSCSLKFVSQVLSAAVRCNRKARGPSLSAAAAHREITKPDGCEAFELNEGWLSRRKSGSRS